MRTAEDPSLLALQETEERFRFLAENVPVQIWTAHPDGSLNFVTEQTARHFGLSAERLLADGWQNVVHPEDLGLAIERWTHALTSGELYEVEFRLKLASGTYAWHLARAVPQRGADGVIARWFGTNTNIEEQRATARRLQALHDEAAQRSEQLRQQNAILLLEAEIGVALTRPGTLREALTACTAIVVRNLDAAFARIWTLDHAGKILELQASAGIYTHTDGAHGRVPVGRFKIGRIAANRKPHLTNQVIGDPEIGDPAWAAREGMVAFAGYPLVLGDTLVGVVAMFARHALSELSVSALGSIANTLALGIQRHRAEEKTRVSETWLSTTLTSIGDGVIATDTEGRVTFLNPVACSLTGSTNADAAGKSLDAIFRIANEETGATVESPVAKVLREGTIVGMANHTVLRRPDGTQIPIDDSAAPIRDSHGALTGVVLVFRDAGEKRRVEVERARLLAEEQRARRDAEAARADLHALFTQAPAPICVLRGPTHVFALANPAYMALVGAERPMLGLSVRDALPEAVAQGYGELLDRVYTTGERFVGSEMPVAFDRRGDGQRDTLFVNFVYEPFRDLDGRVAGIMVVGFDVSDNVLARKTVEATLEDRDRLLAITEDARRKAEIASQAKDEFLATASHELRTPLNAILGWARMLRGKALDATGVLRGLETIERNANAQVQLIEDILDGSRIISGNLHLEIQSVDLGAVVEAAVDTVRPAAAARNIAISVVLERSATRIRADVDRLQQVVWNLLNNAIKFTPKGGHVEVRIAREGTSILLSVKDSGEGIRSDFLPHLFERFRQADGSTTRRHGGLGLGLALVRHLVEAHGGTVLAESEGEGRGATFTVTLPVQAVFPEAVDSARPRPDGAQARVASASNGLHGVSVLVVDDEADARDLVSTLLGLHGAEVVVVSSADEALRLLQQRTPMVLVSDIGMPDADGYALIRRVRALEGAVSKVPALALTAYAREQDRRRAMEAGFDSHIAKPVEPETLLRLVAALARGE